MNKFEENYEKFKRREPKERYLNRKTNEINFALVNKWDTTHLRFVDTAPMVDILQEYELIKKKESKLSSKERGIIVNMVEHGQ
jgi:hypothetical protein